MDSFMSAIFEMNKFKYLQIVNNNFNNWFEGKKIHRVWS